MSRPERRRESTSTSNFGVGRREGHDSSAFYGRFPVPEISEESDVAPPSCVDRQFLGRRRSRDTWTATARGSPTPRWRWWSPHRRTTPARSTRRPSARGTSPPATSTTWTCSTMSSPSAPDKLEPGGRIAVNVANLGRQARTARCRRTSSTSCRTASSCCCAARSSGRRLGVLRAVVPGAHSARPATPYCATVTERVVIASKGRFDRAVPRPGDERESYSRHWEATTDVWEIQPGLHRTPCAGEFSD